MFNGIGPSCEGFTQYIGDGSWFSFLGGAAAGLSVLVFILIAAWSILWKGLALWRAGRNTHKVWFIILLIVNTMGILEILYYFWFSKIRRKK